MATGHWRTAWAGIVCVAAACLLPASVPAADFTWNGSTSGDWGDNSNWETNPTFAAGNDFVFYALPEGNLNTFLNVARIIGGLTFNDDADGAITIRTYSNDSGSGGINRILTFDNGAGNAWINVAAGAAGNITIAPDGGRVALGSNLVVDHSGSGNLEIVNWIGGGTSITKDGTGTFTLSSNNTSMAYENLIINDGKVRVAGSNSVRGVLTMTGGTFSTIGSAQLNLPNVANFSGDLAFGDATDSGVVNFQASSTVTLVGDTTFNTISTLSINAVIGESGGSRSLTKTGTGILFLGNNSNTFAGGLNINGGTVETGNANGRLGATGGAVSFDGGALSFVGGNNATITRATTLDAGGGTIGVASAAATITWTGQFTGAGGLTKTGPGTLVMDSTGAYEGGLNLNGGVVSVLNANDRLGAATGAVSFDGGTLLFRGNQSFSLNADRVTTLNAGGGTIDVLNSAVTATWAGTISGTGSLTKLGAGTLTLAGLNTYAGATQIEAGRLLLTGTLGGSGVSVASGAVLGGTGLVSAPTMIADGGILAPGASTGTIEFNSGLTWGGGGVLQFEINNATGTAGSVTSGWDLVNVTSGSFAITATSEDPFTIEMITLTAAQQPGLADNFNNEIDQAWLLLQHTTEIGAFDADAFQFTTSGFQNSLFPGAGFGLFRGDSSVVQALVSGATNHQLYVVYSVPEPAGLILAGMGLVAAAAMKRRHAIARKHV